MPHLHMTLAVEAMLNTKRNTWSPGVPLGAAVLHQFLPRHPGPPWPTPPINLYITCCLDCTTKMLHMSTGGKCFLKCQLCLFCYLQIFQLALDQEVNADASNCKRSQIMGHLLITMPKSKQIVKPAKPPTVAAKKEQDNNKENINKEENKSRY